MSTIAFAFRRSAKKKSPDGFDVPQIELAPEVMDGVDHILEHNSLLGRPAHGEMNELVIGRDVHALTLKSKRQPNGKK